MENLYVTPCIGVCTINKDSRKCEGCNRSIEDISNWSKYTHEERMIIMRKLGYGKRKSKQRRTSSKNRGS